jgi:hypothetical protein
MQSLTFLLQLVLLLVVMVGLHLVPQASADASHGSRPGAGDVRHGDPLAWGDHGHRMIGLVAAETLPDDMPTFFRSAVAQLSYLNPEPDRWRARDERALDPAMDGKHAPEHYVDFELLPPGALAAAHRLAYADSLRQVDVDAGSAGLLPWRILEMTQRLRVGFRAWHAAGDAQERAFIEQRIINDAGILGHYVADGSNPHHTTIHHNGWIGENPHGYTTDRTFHSRFESVFVRENIHLDDVRAVATAPVRSRDAFRTEIWDYLQQSHSLVERLYQLEQLEPFGPDTRSAEHRQFALERLAAGAAMLRDLWYEAWTSSRGGS